MRSQVSELLAKDEFDSIVCDFLSVAPNIPDIGACSVPDNVKP